MPSADPALVASIRDLAAAGLSQAAIATKLGTTKGRINRACQDNQIRTAGNNGAARRSSWDKRAAGGR